MTLARMTLILRGRRFGVPVYRLLGDRLADT